MLFSDSQFKLGSLFSSLLANFNEILDNVKNLTLEQRILLNKLIESEIKETYYKKILIEEKLVLVVDHIKMLKLNSNDLNIMSFYKGIFDKAVNNNLINKDNYNDLIDSLLSKIYYHQNSEETSKDWEIDQNNVSEFLLSFLSQETNIIPHTNVNQVSIEKKNSISQELRDGILDNNRELTSYIREAAYYIWQKNDDYNDLCWFLAEKKLNQKNLYPIEAEIRIKAKKIFNESLSPDVLHWLIAEIDIISSIKEEIYRLSDLLHSFNVKT